MKLHKTDKVGGELAGRTPEEELSSTGKKNVDETTHKTETPAPPVFDVPRQLLGQVTNAGTTSSDEGVPLLELLRDPGVPGAPPRGETAFARALVDTDVFIFDIDNTLVDTRPRHLEALRILLERNDGLTAADVNALRGVSLDHVYYRPEETAAALGLSPEATQQYVGLWEDVFWDPDLARRADRAMAHVVVLAQRAHRHGKRVVCLTARTEEHWGDKPWQHLRELGLDFLEREDVLLKPEGMDTVEFKNGELANLANDGSSVVLVTDAPGEIRGAHETAQKSPGRIRAIQVQFPYVSGEAPIAPDTPLVAFDESVGVSHIQPREIGVIAGRDGKSAQVTELPTETMAKHKSWRSNFGAGIAQVLDNTLVLHTPRQLPLAAPSLSADRHARIAVGGFFQPPDDAHHEVVRAFLDALVGELGEENVAFMTSATTSPGTLERLVTEVSNDHEVPTVYFTANAYLGKADIEALPEALRPHYQSATKVVLPEKDLYGWAEMATSTALVNTGGQLAAVSDFVKAIQLGNPVVFVVNRDLGPVTFEGGKPSNGAAYVTAMLAARAEIVQRGLAAGQSGAQIEAAVRDPANYPFPFMPQRKFTGDFLAHYGREVSQLVASFEVDGQTPVAPEARAAAEHLRRRLGLQS